jgi:nucleotide-binding universal stress UspA family protein
VRKDVGRPGQPVLAGMMPGQPRVVVDTAAHFAQQLGSPLVCAYVDPARFRTHSAAGTAGVASIDPDAADDGGSSVAGLKSVLALQLAGQDLPWSFEVLAGEAERELSSLADRLGAAMIVVGARQRGIGARLEDIVAGSVAAHLAHHQSRPVLVVPVNGPRHGGTA